MSKPSNNAQQGKYSRRRRRRKQPRTYWIDEFTPKEYLFAFFILLLIGGLTYFYYWRGLELVQTTSLGVVTLTARPIINDSGEYISSIETTKGRFVFSRYVYPFEGEGIELRQYGRGGYKICSAKNDIQAQVSMLNCVSIPEGQAKEIIEKITITDQLNDK